MLYHTDLTTVLQTLAQQSGELHADLKDVVGLAENCRAHLLLVQGQVTSCSIESKSGIVLSSNTALRTLYLLGTFEWVFTPPSQKAVPPTPQLPSPHVESRATLLPTSVPLRVGMVNQREFSSWSRVQRSVYNLLDGKKSIEDIARILALHQERVVEVLSFLQMNAMVTLSSQQQGNREDH